MNKFKLPFIKLTQTPVEFIFDRKIILKRKDKKISNHVSCSSNRVFIKIANALFFAFYFFDIKKFLLESIFIVFFQPQNTYEEIIGLFTEIIIDSTYHVYDNTNTITTTGRHTTRYKYVV